MTPETLLPSGRPKKPFFEGKLPRENLVVLQLNQPFFPFERIRKLQPLTTERLRREQGIGQDAKKATEVNISLQGLMGFISLRHVLPHDPDERHYSFGGTITTPLGPVKYTEVREGWDTTYENTPLRLEILFIAPPSKCKWLEEEVAAEITLGNNNYRLAHQGSSEGDFYLNWFLEAPIYYSFTPTPDEKGKMYQPDIWLPSDPSLLKTIEMRFIERKAIETATA